MLNPRIIGLSVFLHAMLVVLVLLIGRLLPSTGQIAFLSTREGYNKVFLLDADRSIERKLSDIRADKCCLTWSPDGERLVLVTDVSADGNSDIYSIQAYGGDQRRLTSAGQMDIHPVWSPDGQSIAFISWRDGRGEVYIMDRDGQNQRRLTRGASDKSMLAWSPDGQQLAFIAVNRLDSNFYAVDTDCHNDCSAQPIVKATLPGRATAVFWLGGGERVLLSVLRGGAHELYRYDWHSQPERLPISESYMMVASLSPTGRYLTIITDKLADSGQPAELRLLDIACVHQHCPESTLSLTVDVGADEPAWSSDESAVAFRTQRDHNAEIYAMRVDGSGLRRLTFNSAVDMLPAWRPG